MSSGPVRLVLLRHGQSEWNAAGIFTGWENAHLTARGELEAARAGALLAGHGLLPAFVHTSLQRRTIRTADLALAAADRDWIPVRRSWRLNGRHYGALQGRNKAEVLRQYGERQVRLWRRSYDATPPTTHGAAPAGRSPLYDAAARGQAARRVPPGRLRAAAALLVRRDRARPAAGGCVLVVSHGNTLRALVKHLESIPDDQIDALDIPTGIPLVYELGPDLHPDAMGGQYLRTSAPGYGTSKPKAAGTAARMADDRRPGRQQFSGKSPRWCQPPWSPREAL